MLPALFDTMSPVKPEARYMYTPEKGTKFIDTVMILKVRMPRSMIPLIDGKFHNNLKYKS